MLTNPNTLDSPIRPTRRGWAALLWIVTTLLLQQLVWTSLTMAIVIGKLRDSPLARFLYGEPWPWPLLLAVNLGIAIVLPVYLWHRFSIGPGLGRWMTFAAGLAATLFMLLVSVMVYIAGSLILDRIFDL